MEKTHSFFQQSQHIKTRNLFFYFVLAAAGTLFFRNWRSPQKKKLESKSIPQYRTFVEEGEDSFKDRVDEASWESFPASDPPAW